MITQSHPAASCPSHVKVPQHPVWPALSADEKSALKEHRPCSRHKCCPGGALLRRRRPAGAGWRPAAASPTHSRWPAMGSSTDAETLVVCGVRFMGETARSSIPKNAY